MLHAKNYSGACKFVKVVYQVLLVFFWGHSADTLYMRAQLNHSTVISNRVTLPFTR